jgi:hypothetical protein
MKPEATSDASSCEMIIQRFRVAAKGHGKYCSIKNELLVRKGRMTCRITCEKYMLRFTAPGCSEFLIPFAPDVKVHEFRRTIAWLVDTRNGMDFGTKTTGLS